MQAEIDQCILFWVFMTNLKVSRKFYGTRGLKHIDHFHYFIILSKQNFEFLKLNLSLIFI